MADKLYAWSRILGTSEVDDKGNVLSQVVIMPGEEVTASKLDISDAQLQELVDIGSVRNYPFPEELQDRATSPNRLIADALSDAEGVAAAYGVSEHLVSAFGKQQKQIQKAPAPGAEVKKD